SPPFFRALLLINLRSLVSVGRTSRSRLVSRVAKSISDSVLWLRYVERGDEAVASSGNIDDEPVAVFSVAQHAAQCRNMDRKVGRLDESIRPDVCHQFLLADQLACAVKQDNQDFQSAAPKGQRLFAFEQKKLCREQAKWSE